jgi:hypothetical protein
VRFSCAASFRDSTFDGGERGTRESDFMKEYGTEPLGAFIRSIIGLDIMLLAMLLKSWKSKSKRQLLSTKQSFRTSPRMVL